MTVFTSMQAATSLPWMGLYLRILAVIVLLGASVHVGNIVGLNGGPWLEKSLTIQILDVVLLILNIVLAFGLWHRQAWSVFALLGVLLLFQFIPYTLFIDYFATTAEERQTIIGLLGIEGLMVAILVVLYIVKK